MDVPPLTCHIHYADYHGRVRYFQKIARYLDVPSNRVTSKLQGSAARLYLSGLPLIEAYPISAICHGLAVNIKALIHHDRINVGIMVWEGAMIDARGFSTPAKQSISANSLEVRETIGSGDAWEADKQQ